MKRILFLAGAGLVLFFTLTAESCYGPPTASEQNSRASNEAAQAAITAVAVPQISYFPERQTIARWASAWDKPDIPTYVYLVSFGKIIGYYVCSGKPASTQSYLFPETTYQPVESPKRPGYSSASSYEMTEAPDIDGTYGANNPGIRFFTASGIAVEWAGDGASYIYSNAILPLDVPVLGK